MNEVPSPAPAAPHAGSGVAEALRTAWTTSGGCAGVLVASAPTVAFVVLSGPAGLTAAAVTHAATGPVFATLAAATLIAARRRLAHDRAR